MPGKVPQDEAHAVEQSRQGLASQLAAPLVVQVGKCLLYQVRVNEHLVVTTDPRNPKKGKGAFETDLCVLETRHEAGSDAPILLPRVVLEYKLSATTHDILTYSAKAASHKQIYPYLRYGLVCTRAKKVPEKFFWHGAALDFFIGLAAYDDRWLLDGLLPLVRQEIETSKLLERIAFGKVSGPYVRRETLLGTSA